MKVRQHRELLDDSMDTCTEIQPTKERLAKHIADRWGLKGLANRKVHVKKYSYDHRIGWDTYIVTVDGMGVFGFTDGPVDKPS